MTDAELMKKLREDNMFNPWLSVADGWLEELNDGNHTNFVHPSDSEKLVLYDTKLGESFSRRRNSKKHHSKDYKGRPTKEDMRLVLDLLPQPFIGDPCSPIWILLRNPGYSAIDEYDLMSITRGKDAIKKEGLTSVRNLRFHNQVNERQMLSKRQQFVCRQLKFDLDQGKEFYILRDEFDTLNFNNGSRKVFGGHNWYMKYLFPTRGYLSHFTNKMSHLEIASKGIFVLEYTPYHSRAYFESKVDFVHHTVWTELVKHGIQSKIIIARGGDIVGHIQKSVPAQDLFKANKERRLFVFKGQSASFSNNNLFWPCLDKDSSDPLSRIQI